MNREDLDQFCRTTLLPPWYRREGNDLLVNGALGQSVLWADIEDQSLTPCLTGQVGGMIGGWENWVVAWHLNNLDRFVNYIDIGANLGYYTFLMAGMKHNVMAFEPNEKYVRLLKKSMDENQFDNIVVFPMAVCEKPFGTVELEFFGNLHGSTRISKNGTAQVACTNLDSIEFFEGPTLIKIDAEGAEERIWQGARYANSKYQPTYIMEWTPQAYSDAFYADLTDYGTVSLVDEQGREQHVLESHLRSLSDWCTIVVRPYV